METSLREKAIIVTGGASGIGFEVVKLLASCGSRIMVSDIDRQRGETVAGELVQRGVDAAFCACDVVDAAAVRVLVETTRERFGRVDGAVNNAGIETRGAKLADHDDEDFDRLIAVNLRGVYLCMKHELRVMCEQGGGVIVNTASVAGLGGAPTFGGYAASKHGVIGLTRTAAVEYGKRGIRVNAVCPSYTLTPMVERMLEREPDLGPALTRASPMRRMGEPQEVARAIAWLLSDGASFTNGQALALDGGLTAW
jgi:NAD(P)-dependent dehydrogenase (short-subunit alcohol dehydrogenase family)